jgi:sec-independent protein translocase protein TatA
MIPNIGFGEMVLIFLVVLLLFGAKRLPEIGSSLGKGIREFKTSMKDVEREIKAPTQPTYVPPPQPVSQFKALEKPAAQTTPAEPGKAAEQTTAAASATQD